MSNTKTYTVFDPETGIVKAHHIVADELTRFLVELTSTEREPDSDLLWLTVRLNPTRAFVTTDEAYDAWVERGKPLHDLPRSALRNEDGSPAQGTK